MTSRPFTLDDLKPILIASAGEGEGLDGDVLDTHFEELGYESLALLETGGRIEREYRIRLDDEVLAEAVTPRALIDAVNEALSTAAES